MKTLSEELYVVMTQKRHLVDLEEKMGRFLMFCNLDEICEKSMKEG